MTANVNGKCQTSSGVIDFLCLLCSSNVFVLFYLCFCLFCSCFVTCVASFPASASPALDSLISCFASFPASASDAFDHHRPYMFTGILFWTCISRNTSKAKFIRAGIWFVYKVTDSLIGFMFTMWFSVGDKLVVRYSICFACAAEVCRLPCVMFDASQLQR